MLGWRGRELRLLYGFNQYTQLQNRDNSGLLCTPIYCIAQSWGGGGGRCLPNAQVGEGGRPPAPPPPPLWTCKCYTHRGHIVSTLVAEYIHISGTERSEEQDEMFTITPPPLVTILGNSIRDICIIMKRKNLTEWLDPPHAQFSYIVRKVHANVRIYVTTDLNNRLAVELHHIIKLLQEKKVHKVPYFWYLLLT